MAESSLLSLTGEIECPVCLLILDDPVILPCGHSFCRNCARELFQERTVQCPYCRQIHRLSPDDLMTNFQLRTIIEKATGDGTLEVEPIIVASSEEVFCKNCLCPVSKFDQAHAGCSKISVQAGNRLVEHREDAAVENQPKILCSRAAESSEKSEKQKQTAMRKLQGEVNKVADKTIELVNQQREMLNKKIEENYLSDIEKLLRHSAEIRKKLKDLELFTPDRSENLINRIGKLKAVEVEIKEFCLPELEALEAELLEFQHNILSPENFSFGELLTQQQPTANNLPVLHSRVTSGSSDDLPNPVPMGGFRQAAARDGRFSKLRNVARERAHRKAENSSLQGLNQPLDLADSPVDQSLGRRVEQSSGRSFLRRGGASDSGASRAATASGRWGRRHMHKDAGTSSPNSGSS